MPSSNIFPTDFYYSGINNKETDEIPMLFDYLIDLKIDVTRDGTQDINGILYVSVIYAKVEGV